MTRAKIRSRVAALVSRTRDARHAISPPKRLHVLHRELGEILSREHSRGIEAPALPDPGILPPLP